MIGERSRKSSNSAQNAAKETTNESSHEPRKFLDTKPCTSV
jgi:hypothetical protein